MRLISRLVRGSVMALPLLLGALLCACSETHEPIDWREAVRGGTEGLDTLETAALVRDSGTAGAHVATGLSPYLMTGRIERFGQEVRAATFMQWNLDALPAGEVTAAHLEMHLHHFDVPGTDAGAIPLEMHRVTSAWSEDSLGLGGTPSADADVIATAEVDTTNIGASDGIALKSIFGGEDDLPFRDLVGAWVAGSAANHGIEVVPAPGAPQGILRFWSAEGLPTGLTTFNSPLLVVTVHAGGADSTVSLEAAHDGFVAQLTGGGRVAMPDTLLLVSGGFVQRAALHFDPAPLRELMAADSVSALLVTKAMLHLTLAPDLDWSLAEGETLPILAYAADSLDYGALDSLPNTVLDQRVALVTITGGAESVDIPIVSFVQRLIEGGSRDLVLLANTEVLGANSALFKSTAARAGAPRLEVVFIRTDGRLDP